jgi:hypothetical protein
MRTHRRRVRGVPQISARHSFFSFTVFLLLYCSTALDSPALAQRGGWREDPAEVGVSGMARTIWLFLV